MQITISCLMWTSSDTEPIRRLRNRPSCKGKVRPGHASTSHLEDSSEGREVVELYEFSQSFSLPAFYL